MTSKQLTFQLIQIISLATSGIGALTLAGYLAGSPFLYAWSGIIPMAINTAVCFVLQGICLFLLARRSYYNIKKNQN